MRRTRSMARKSFSKRSEHVRHQRDMAMNRFVRHFCINRFGMGLLHYYSSRSDFGKFDIPTWKTTPRINDTGSRRLRVSLIRGVEFVEIFLFEKRLPVSTIQGVADSAYQWYGESTVSMHSLHWSLWIRHMSVVQTRPDAAQASVADTSRRRTLLYSADTSRCSSGLCGRHLQEQYTPL